MEITKKEIKERLYELGADLCGIAGVDRFGEAPEGITRWMCCLPANR